MVQYISHILSKGKHPKNDQHLNIISKVHTSSLHKIKMDFYRWLQGSKFSVAKGEDFTHTSMILPTGRFYVPTDKRGEFWYRYCHSLKNGEILGIQERPDSTCSPLYTDIDLKYELGPIEKRYKQKHIKKVITIYRQVLKEILITIDDSDLICCVLEKTKPYIKKGKLCEGFHLHFPYVILPNEIIQDTIRPKVISMLKDQKVFDDLEGLLSSYNNIIDKAIPRQVWLLYGGRKDHKAESYLLTRIYNTCFDKITLEKAFWELYNILVFASRDLNNVEEVDVVKDTDTESEDSDILYPDNIFKYSIDYYDLFWKEDAEYDFFLPAFLSVREREISHVVKPSIIKPIMVRGIRSIRNIRKSKGIIPDEVVKKNLEEIETILPHLASHRYEDRNDWIAVGWFLHTLGNASDKALDMWINFSSQWHSFEEGECEAEWENMYIGNFTMGTIYGWLKKDNPTFFEKWLSTKIQPSLMKAANSNTHYDVAKTLHCKYGHSFICSSITKKKWYMYNGHRWEDMDGATNLRKIMSEELVKDIYGLLADLTTKRREMEEGTFEADKYDDYIKQTTSLPSKLKTKNFKDSILTECKDLFYRKNFDSRLDTNPNLLGFENGVYDLETMTFREGRYEDYISFSTGYDYMEFPPDSQEIIDLQEFLQKVFTKKTLRNYFMRFCASCLQGGNKHKIFMIFAGRIGNNGKSATVRLMEKAFGQYFKKAPTSLVTGNRPKSNETNSELKLTKGARIVVVQEPGEHERINIGTVKELTGNDSIYLRGLYEDGSNYLPLFTLIMHCNKIPSIPGSDVAMMERIKVLDYLSLFNDNALPTREEQFKARHFIADKELDAKLDYLAPAFMFLLIQEYHKYKKFGIKEPDYVREAVSKYRNSNDIYGLFISEVTEKNKKGKIVIQDAWDCFRDWVKNSTMKKGLPDKFDFVEEISLRWGSPYGNRYWKGHVIIKTEEGEIEESKF